MLFSCSSLGKVACLSASLAFSCGENRDIRLADAPGERRVQLTPWITRQGYGPAKARVRGFPRRVSDPAFRFAPPMGYDPAPFRGSKALLSLAK